MCLEDCVDLVRDVINDRIRAVGNARETGSIDIYERRHRLGLTSHLEVGDQVDVEGGKCPRPHIGYDGNPKSLSALWLHQMGRPEGKTEPITQIHRYAGAPDGFGLSEVDGQAVKIDAQGVTSDSRKAGEQGC